MKRVNDSPLLERYLKEYKIKEFFSTCSPEFILFLYSPGELLTTPFSPSSYIQFVVDGNLILYDMPDEESTIMLQPSFDDVAMLGEMELIDSQFVPFFVEAGSDVYAVAVSSDQFRNQLLEDPVFLLHLCRSLAKKLSGAVRASVSMPLKKRIAFMINYSSTEYISDIGRVADMMNTSRRQLLRVLKQFCEEGVLEHFGKGKYRILKKAALP